jgi:hypothetical protein
LIVEGAPNPDIYNGIVMPGKECFRRWRLIDEAVLPLTGLALVMYRRTKRGIATKAPVHVNHLLIRNTKVLRNQRHLIGVHVAALQCNDFVFCRSQLEKELFLACRGAYFHK